MSGPSLGSVTIDLPKLLETRLLVQSNSGGGKSWFLRRLLEQTVGHVQQLVIDPEGEFSTLRERHDYIVCAPRGADAVATPKTAAALALALWRAGTSAILDVYELKAHERIEFARRFLDALTNAPREIWHPTMVVLDESHLFAPQVGSAESLGAVIDIATRGRKRGLALVAATQRISKLHKDVAAELLNKAIGRTQLDIDVRRASDELGLPPREALSMLRDRDPGQFFVYGPALSPTVQVTTIGPVQTTHPQTGRRALAAPPPASAKVRAQLARLEGIQKEAEADARTVADLQAEVTKLRRELTMAQRVPHVGQEAEIERRVTAGIERAMALLPPPMEVDVDAVEVDLFRSLADSMEEMLRSRAAQRAKGKMPPQLRPVDIVTARTPKAGPTTRAAQVERSVARAPAAGVSSSQQRILDSLAALAAFGLDAPEKETLAAHAGVPHTSGGFRNNLSALRTSGRIEYPAAGAVALTDAGRAIASAPTRAPTLPELHEAWLQLVSGPQATILRLLIDAYPSAIDKAELARMAQVPSTSGGYRNNLSRLHTMRAIGYPGPGLARAADILFPKGHQ